MTRHRRRRMVNYIPNNKVFYPGNYNDSMETITLTIEEVESIRLSDLENLDQTACAEKMEISRTTFQRILGSAKQKIADSIVNGKKIIIEGGDFMFRGIGRGQGGIGRGLAANTTGRCRTNPDMPAGFRRFFYNSEIDNESLEIYKENLKKEYDRVNSLLNEKSDK